MRARLAPNLAPLFTVSLAAFCATTLLGAFTLTAEDEPEPRVGIVAEVNGNPITSYELERRLQQELVRLQAAGNSPETLRRNMEQIRRDTLELMILNRLLLQRCDEEKIKVSETAVEDYIMARVRETGQRVTSMPEFFRDYEAKTGESESEVRKHLRESLRIQELYRRTVVTRSYISPGDLRAYYAAHRDEFETEASYRYRHLFVPRGNPDLNKIDEQIQQQIQEGVPFEKLVERFSVYFNKEQGGLYDVTDSALENHAAPMPEMIRSLKPGETSKRLSNDIGIHYFHMESMIPGDPIPFEEAQEKIRVKINSQRRSLQFDRLEEDLRKKAYIRRYLDPRP